MSRIRGLIAILFMTLGATNGRAKDYDLDSERWNGLGYLLTTAEEARVALDVGDVVDLSTLEPEDVLVVLYPTTPLPVDDLLSFVESGGYLVIADDLGLARPLLERLGVKRRDAGPTAHLAFWDHQEGFPIMRPAGEHFLFFNVQQVVVNHPSALTIDTPRDGLRPILSFDGGREHFVVEATLGGGRVLALSDPSIFLNDMLRRFYGDKQFVANALRLYCQREPCSAHLVRPEASWRGRFDAERARLGSLPKEIEARVQEINEALAWFSSELAEPPWALALPGLLLLALIVLAARVRGRERVPVSGLVTAVPPHLSSPALDEARGLVVQRHEADFSHLALILCEHTLERAQRVDLGTFARTPPDGHEHERLRASLLRVEAETASLRSRQPPIWSADRFLRLHEDVQVLVRFLPEAGRARRTHRV